jgi:hypothetical protein
MSTYRWDWVSRINIKGFYVVWVNILDVVGIKYQSRFLQLF